LGALLSYFPAPLPDEAIISLVTRYHILRAHRSEQLTYDELFNAPPFSLTFWVPSYLDRLANKLLGDAEENLSHLLESSTLLPLFRVFGMGIQGPEAGNQKIGFVAPKRIVGESGTTHLCPSCIVDDAKEYGSPYIHRAHQIPGVMACWKHGTKTIVRCQSCKCPFETRNGLILSPWKGCNCGRHVDGSTRPVEQALPIEIEFAKFAMDLLEGAVFVEPELLVKVYKSRILELGFRRGGNQIARAELFSVIQESYGQEQLRKMDSAYRNGRTGGWLHLLHVSSVIEVPLGRHLLLTHFLYREANLFLNAVKRARNDILVTQSQIGAQFSVDAEKTKKRSGRKNLTKDELVRMLVVDAKRNSYGLEELWKNQLFYMKKLVRLDPNATQIILEQLSSDYQDSTIRSPSKFLAINYDREADERLVTAIKKAAELLYASADDPVRITKNRLLKSVKVKAPAWLSPSKVPLAYTSHEKCIESQWHFYARRMIWILYKYPEYEGREGKLVKLSKLESHKGVAIYRYFCHIDRKRQLTTNTIISILEEMGIPKNWHGPNPDRNYYVTGRRYTKRERIQKNADQSMDES
jgi:hypothetical protein